MKRRKGVVENWKEKGNEIINMIQDEIYMKEAIKQAKKAKDIGDVPIG